MDSFCHITWFQKFRDNDRIVSGQTKMVFPGRLKSYHIFSLINGFYIHRAFSNIDHLFAIIWLQNLVEFLYGLFHFKMILVMSHRSNSNQVKPVPLHFHFPFVFLLNKTHKTSRKYDIYDAEMKMLLKISLQLFVH